MFYRVFSVLSYLMFLASILYAVGFMADVFVPKTIDAPVDDSDWRAVFVDAMALVAFGMQHSIMARPAFKRWWVRFVPERIERSMYVLMSSLTLCLVFVAWRPLPDLVWDVSGSPAATLLYVMCAIGWLVVLLSTFMISHFELFGLTQAWRRAKAHSHSEAPFVERFFYRFVRHPIMLGFVIAFWATPVMTYGHLLFSVLTTGYILVGIQFEEVDLRAKIGNAYDSYRARVPMLVPFMKRRSR